MGAPAPRLRVGHLAIRVADRDHVGPFRRDLEDALRTATLPFGGSGAIIRIRRVDLGRVPPGLSRQALARLLEARLAALPFERLQVDRPLPLAAAAVLIPDRVTAAALALDAVLAKAPMHWALAATFPASERGAMADRIFSILSALIVDAGSAALGRLALLGRVRFFAALGLVSDQQARALARVFGPVPTAAGTLPRPTTAPVRALLRPRPQAIAARQLRAAAAALLPRVPTAVQAAMAEHAVLWGPAAPHTQLTVAALAVAGGGAQAAEPALRRWLSLTEARPGPASRPAPIQVRAVQATGRGGAHRRSNGIDAPPLPTMDRVPAAAAHDAISEMPAGLAGVAGLGPESPHAGLWLLVSVLRLAGVESAEAAHRMLLGIEVLRGFAFRLPVSGTDPALTVLDQAPSLADEHPAMGTWRPAITLLPLLAGSRPIAIRRAGAARAVLACGRLPVLGVVDCQGIGTLRRSGLTMAALRGRAEVVRPGLLRSLTLTSQRLCIRLAGVPWRSLATRPGRVLVTPTHVDVTFDARLVDARIRMAGLDLDPGWVPWLGRVVAFHYDYSQVRDHVRVLADAPPGSDRS